MNVQELIAELQKYPADTEVFVPGIGAYHEVVWDEPDVELRKHDDDGRDVLVIW